MAKEVLNDTDFPPGELPDDAWLPWIKPDGTRGKTAGAQVGGGGGAFVAPEIIKHYTARGNANQTISIDTPAAGNWFLAIMSGFNATFTFPTGFDKLYDETLISNQRIAVGFKECVGDETSLTFSRSADIINVSLVELDGFDNFRQLSAGNAGTDGTFSKVEFPPPWGKTGLTVFAAEYDGSGSMDITSEDGLLYEDILVAGGSNHTGLHAFFDEELRAKKITGTNSSPSGSFPIQYLMFSVAKDAT